MQHEFRRKLKHVRLGRWVHVGAQHTLECVTHALFDFARVLVLKHLFMEAFVQRLTILPAIEEVRVVTGTKGNVLVIIIAGCGQQQNRSGKVSKERGDRIAVQPVKSEHLRLLSQIQNRRGDDFLPGRSVEQPDRYGYVQGTLHAPAALGQLQGERAGVVVAVLVGDGRGSWREEPQRELFQTVVDQILVRVRHGPVEIVQGRAAPVVTARVQGQAPPETLDAQDGLVHSTNLRALVVRGRRPKVLDRIVTLPSDGLTVDGGVFDELLLAENFHRLDPYGRL
mmetsp:Transcript_4114/g.11313  ORF Transcript_4114/g.11313 Transcript_4114/m.11313 type:complete len:282 (-) Transcript_4114:725-1570(-)